MTTLENTTSEMDRRYATMRDAQATTIEELGESKPPYSITFIDEVADLGSQSKEAFELIQRLAQKGRAAGIYIVLSTQYPTAKSIPSEIKANLNTRIAFKLQSSIQIEVVMDQDGAELLVPPGDCLYRAAGSTLVSRCLVPEMSDSFQDWFKEQFVSQKKAA